VDVGIVPAARSILPWLFGPHWDPPYGGSISPPTVWETRDPKGGEGRRCSTIFLEAGVGV